MNVKSQLPHLLWNSGSMEMYLVMRYCEWACRPWNLCMLVQFSHSVFAAPWTAGCCRMLFITSSWSLLKLMSIESEMPSNHLILCPLLLLPSIFPRIRVFSNESVLDIRWPKYWSFSISPSDEYSGLISFRMDWLDLLAVQGTLKSLLQHHSSKASILWLIYSSSHIHSWLLEKP